ncbi:hypothetical protein Gbth_028_031 [Gluconobacter thailandicus F149-1 = NBRC 100600]|uniref:Uncharacterized protein n=1 Tax=Gluconobacter thailandicus NBRC 3257 TaxID=1381097 RepID=A0ABQ0IZ86_GLUTH|nr:hypothetical protein NBRC3257_2487 [Gluconobacter thailandicus NBRC 3257]GAN93635.1 hypothetical protein Gbth_028_031 [Gluconobacter thailandicus F149-1 = NBRC 100600]GBR61133.1 hypothetical protein AA100600_2516 [Gluconobacter thailandicus F149-1 = NBRC 100600]GEL87008.1 hypothetical protein GTH01_13660 [Gluconobacter thailandicus F149-1 = NBRC 100600]
MQVVGDNPKITMATQRASKSLGRRADIDKERRAIRYKCCRASSNRVLRLQVEDLALIIGNIFNRGVRRGPSMMPDQKPLLRQETDISADGLDRYIELLGQVFIRDISLTANQPNDLLLARIDPKREIAHAH